MPCWLYIKFVQQHHYHRCHFELQKKWERASEREKWERWKQSGRRLINRIVIMNDLHKKKHPPINVVTISHRSVHYSQFTIHMQCSWCCGAVQFSLVYSQFLLRSHTLQTSYPRTNNAEHTHTHNQNFELAPKVDTVEKTITTQLVSMNYFVVFEYWCEPFALHSAVICLATSWCSFDAHGAIFHGTCIFLLNEKTMGNSMDRLSTSFGWAVFVHGSYAHA